MDDLTYPIVGNFRQTFLRFVFANASEKISPRRDSNRSPLVNVKKILRSKGSSPELAGPGPGAKIVFINIP